MKEQNTAVKPLGIPYGMMNFVAIREDNYYYVDKTRFIEKIENSNRYFFFFRPRRFGKSLTMSMLHHYYDINAADKFERLYGDLYIGKNPTPNRNKYLVINLNFAVINADLGNYRSAMDAHCNTRFNSFCDQYAAYLPVGIKEELNKKNGCVEQLDYLCKACLNAGQKIYLFIDEYDHFTNNILSGATREYLNSKATDALVASTIEQAKAQVCRYADTVKAKEQIGTTKLHKVYVVYRGVEMVACKEVDTLKKFNL